MRKTLEKILSLAFSLALFGYLAAGAHEQFHQLAANALGVRGHVQFWVWTGFFYYDTIPTPFQDFVIGLAGGLGTGLVFGGLWWLAHTQARYTEWELDDSLGLAIIAVGQLVYAIFDAFDCYLGGYAGGIGMAVATAIALMLYGQRILAWLREEAPT